MSNELSIRNADPLPPPPPPTRWGVVVVTVVGVLAIVGAGSTALLAKVGRPLAASPFVAPAVSDDDDPDEAQLRRRAVRAGEVLQAVRPSGPYIVVDSYRNRLQLYRGGELLRDALCSTGTGIVLRDPRNGHTWVFDTPLGERVIERKVKNPVWAKPDWAFIEEGQLPPTDPNERFDNVSLGDFALYMGNGYIIHGTLFPSLLGRRVTHGCIRLGDKDLDFVYHNAPIGTRVFLY
jgi:lipoprotein-anchoring transpeptidase ErfK/SrfK